MSKDWLNKEEAAKMLGLSTKTLERKRYTGEFVEGVHYQRAGAGKSCPVRYYAPLLSHWISTLHDPDLHKRAIEKRLRDLREIPALTT